MAVINVLENCLDISQYNNYMNVFVMILNCAGNVNQDNSTGYQIRL